MAKLGSYYGLCPLTDHRNLLGISKGDQEDTIVASLDANLAVKFKLSNQKQLQSWRTKEKFSSPIIYCKAEAKYVVAFNQSHIRLWNGDEEYLDKLKKIKFPKRIHTIFECNDKSFIVFTNGCVKLVSEAIELRKESKSNFDDVLTSGESISEVVHACLNEEVFVGLLVVSERGQYLSWTRVGSDVFHKISLDRVNVKLNDCAFHIDQSSVLFLSLWNDGKVFSTVLDDSQSSAKLGELFTVIDSLSCKEHVSMISLDQDYLALYGASCDEEGATLLLFNVQFKVTQCKLILKFFTKETKLWCVQDNLFVSVGRNLAVVPFHLDEEQLAALVGSHKIAPEKEDSDVSIVQKLQEVSWGSEPKSTESSTKKLPAKIQELTAQGLPETIIVEELLPELIKNNDFDGISEMVQLFSNISEKCLAYLLHLFLTMDESTFSSGVDCGHEDFPKGLQPLQRAALVDLLLEKSFNDALLVPHLRNQLSTDEVLNLLQYFWFLMKEEGYDLAGMDSCATSAKVVEWSCVLLDANYQKLLLSKDPKIKEVLAVFIQLMKEGRDDFDEMVQLLAVLDEMKKGNTLQKSSSVSDSKYSVEELDI